MSISSLVRFAGIILVISILNIHNVLQDPQDRE
jgi:hypothetical protein